jgi:hypothetical protein
VRAKWSCPSESYGGAKAIVTAASGRGHAEKKRLSTESTWTRLTTALCADARGTTFKVLGQRHCAVRGQTSVGKHLRPSGTT